MVEILVAGGLATAIALLGTPPFIRLLVRRRYGQHIRDDLAHYADKRGKPTMGGAVIIAAAALGYLGAHTVVIALNALGMPVGAPSPTSLGAMLVLLLLVGLGVIGFLDDWTKIRKERSLGLTSRQKLVGQTVVTVCFSLAALLLTDSRGRALASTAVSFIRDTSLDLRAAGPVLAGLLFLLWANALIAGASNGVNISDGLDGLATGASAVVFGAYTMIGLWQHVQSCDTAPGPSCYDVRDALDLAVLACAISGACLGFLWWNAAPARIIMGDTGSLSLGGALAGLAILTRTELLLGVLGALFVIITGSVIIQVISYKTTRKRVFRIAPLHHHFEMVGWSEITIVTRFWIISGICVLLGLGIFYAEWVTGV